MNLHDMFNDVHEYILQELTNLLSKTPLPSHSEQVDLTPYNPTEIIFSGVWASKASDIVSKG